MQDLLLRLFKDFDQADIQYCLLRGYEELDDIDDRSDIDILVQVDQVDRLREILERLEFVSLSSWGRAPHHFFVGYNQSDDRWLKLDIVTTIAYGNPIHAIYTDLAARCLQRRIKRGLVFVASPEDELLTLLLHCVLDKAMFASNRRQRIATLKHDIEDEKYLTTLLQRYWAPGMTWQRLAAMIDAAGWDELLSQRSAVAAWLARRQKLRVRSRQIYGLVLRKLDRVAGLFQPRSLTVALLAPDGGGKTTLATELARTFYLPSRYIYMGSHSDVDATRLPTTRWIQARSNQARSSRNLPIWLVVRGLRFANNLVEQWYRYGMSYYHRMRGRLVLFDRYAYDVNAHGYSKLSVKSRTRRWLLSAVAPKPDLIVFLDAPGEMLYARKGEHSPEVLEAQRQHYLGLQKRLPQMIVVDATHDADYVRRTVTSLIWRRYADLFQRGFARG